MDAKQERNTALDPNFLLSVLNSPKELATRLVVRLTFFFHSFPLIIRAHIALEPGFPLRANFRAFSPFCCFADAQIRLLSPFIAT